MSVSRLSAATPAGPVPGREVTTSGPGRRARRRSAKSVRWGALGFISPGALAVLVVLYVPFVYTIVLSFTEYDGLTAPKWVALRNFRKFLDDPALSTSVRNTVYWVIGSTVVPVGLGLIIALLTFGMKRGTLFRLPFVLPYALSGAGLGVIWGFILQSGGALNDVLRVFHLPGADLSFLQHQPYNTIAMIVAWTWQQSGVNMLFFLVGLQSIPAQPMEAARLDGATGWKLFRHVTWPLLAPLTTVVIGLSLVSSLKTFDIVWVTTQGGPGRSSETLAVTMYRDAFVSGQYGYGSAVALVLTLVTGSVTLIYLRQQTSRREDLA